ncbi:hypothetical protein FFF34_014940 [Inquilinus sp. KBS0705]|nr:hypothetical protein FFF34_014940 [Inquilinus sp. KBS0705]
MKKVAYLLGAGASQAVVSHINPDNGLMTTDIRNVIQKQYSSAPFDTNIWNEILTEEYDLEQIISVMEYQYQYASSTTLRRYYRDAIVKLSKKISANPPKSNLYSILIDMHLNLQNSLDEELLCIISLNYEDILEKTIDKHFKIQVDYGINKLPTANGIQIFKLHGSFNWENVRPIKVATNMTSLRSENTLWIPPGVDKRKENYPFNLLWGKANEAIMNCDVIRVVGCSLSRNDWGLIPMLYTIQKFHSTGHKFAIEIIDFPEIAEKIKTNYKYLDITSIDDIPEFFDFYKKQFPSASDDAIKTEIVNSLNNPLQSWLEAKIEYLIKRSKDINTPKKLVYDFYYKTA